MAKKMIKSSRKTTKRLRKFEDGGMAGKGPLQPTPKKVLTSEEAAKEAMSRLTNPFGLSKTETPSIVGKSPLQSAVKTEAPKAAVVAPKAKLLPGGFKDQAQKDAYIKSTKNLLKTKSVSDLVKMKHGTAAGLSSLGFKDEVKKAAPVSKAPATKIPTKKRDNSKNLLYKKSVNLYGVELPEKNAISGMARKLRKDVAAGAGRGRTDAPINFKMNTPAPLKNKANTKTPVAKAPVANKTTPNKVIPKKGKEDGQALKAEGLKMKGIGMAIKGKGLRNKAIASTHYRNLQVKVGKDTNPISKALMPLALKIKGKSQVKYVKYRPNNSELNQVEIDAMKKAKIIANKNKAAAKAPATYKVSSKTAAKNLPGGGKLVTNINTKKDGSKQIKTTSYNKAGKAGKSLYKEILPRYGEDKKKGVKWAINKAGTKSTIINTKTGDIEVNKGSNIQLTNNKSPEYRGAGSNSIINAPGSIIGKHTFKGKGDKKTFSYDKPLNFMYGKAPASDEAYRAMGLFKSLTPAQAKKKGQELKQKGIGQKRAGQLFKQMAKPRESFAKRYGLPEVSKKITEPLDIAMSFVAPAGRAKGAKNLWQLGSKLLKGRAKTKAGAEAIKKTVEVVKKGAETSKKGADVIAKTSKTAKANRAAITRAQKGGLDKILRKGEGLPKVKDVVQKAANTTKSNRATITRKQKGGLDKMLKLGEGK